MVEPKVRRRGIYLLPNLLTITGLFAGFFSIVAGMKGYFYMAAEAIFIAMIMDALDGRVARLTNTQSDFGMELDSLADVVSFGVAPALVMYSWSLTTLGKAGWLAAFIFAAAGALRLARFNTQAASSDKRYFQGIPIPAAAGILASIVWVWYDYTTQSKIFVITMCIITILVAALMVSNIRFHSFKDISVRDRVPFLGVLVMVLILVCIAIDPPTMLLVIFAAYGISGPVMTLWALRQRRQVRLKERARNHPSN
ncbi:MAG: CDP-diacylglycerol--serine O-phosphatidyltransferase [Legionellales bacterium]|nr:CDP-diacylglycerol--serine O-phosphatidyltransferase [Legionellales bacterium]